MNKVELSAIAAKLLESHKRLANALDALITGLEDGVYVSDLVREDAHAALRHADKLLTKEGGHCSDEELLRISGFDEQGAPF